MIKQLALVVFVILVVLSVVASRKPGSFRVERSTTIHAMPDKVFGLINDFHNFGAWSPWETLDPNLSRSITGPANGKGAVYEWSGNMKAGVGRMEILESIPSSRIVMKLNFIKPFESQSTAEYTLQPVGDSTKVTWAMFGPSPFVSKVMQVFITMDDMLGPDFEKGLAQMKAAAEK